MPSIPPAAPTSLPRPSPLRDPFGRAITYLRLSLTDRCDFRCVYCMAKETVFLPRHALLTIEELLRLAWLFVDLGVRKIRLTGGEPLVRRGIAPLLAGLAPRVRRGRLAELTLTTNGGRLAEFAPLLVASGVRRVNVSLDSLDPATFRAITRTGSLDRVMTGIDAATAAGLAVKINTVALKGVNEDELVDLVGWCGARGHDLTLIEVMPMGGVDGDQRAARFLPLSVVQERLARRWTLRPTDARTGGPARYWRVAETGGLLGLITPLSQNFCDGCNRVRLDCRGNLRACLGHERAGDLKTLLRSGADDAALAAAIADVIAAKPARHAFAPPASLPGAGPPAPMPELRDADAPAPVERTDAPPLRAMHAIGG